MKLFSASTVKDHLFFHGIDVTYEQWIWHWEAPRIENINRPRSSSTINSNIDMNVEDTIEDDRLDDLIKNIEDNFTRKPEQFEEFLEDARTPLFPGCNNFTKPSALMRLYNLKATNGWSNKGFSDLLQLLKEMLPAPNQLPISTYEAKKIICKLGMNYEKISACPNDCVLYRNEYIDLNQCPQCKKSRWKLCADDTKKKSWCSSKGYVVFVTYTTFYMIIS
ncbi:hypothetical protein AXF42_Ash014411 [Apostasia shenzhenica]|uniref:Uncharacterized protein n=1 Tax=Apostasia shenzhenica TaxID=1088818 RepID=A0A2I0B146_9ASPA|nr:hypothetical protein AXF42_Ash014411 [Apostasia shenzhenica]